MKNQRNPFEYTENGEEEKKEERFPNINRESRESRQGARPARNQTTGPETRPNIHRPGAHPFGGMNPREAMAGIRARTTTFRTQDGNVISILNIGVPAGHPLAGDSMAGPSGLHNVQVGGIPMPAPMFGFMHRNRGAAGGSGEENKNNTAEQEREA